jgi:aminopeptidase C
MLENILSTIVEEKVQSKQTKSLKLNVLLFAHFMNEDNDHLSFGEKLRIKKIIKKNKKDLVKDDYKEMVSFLKRPPSFGYILDYCKDNKYKYQDLVQSIELFKKLTKNSTKYKNIIGSVSNKLLSEKEFLK